MVGKIIESTDKLALLEPLIILPSQKKTAPESKLSQK